MKKRASLSGTSVPGGTTRIYQYFLCKLIDATSTHIFKNNDPSRTSLGLFGRMLLLSIFGLAALTSFAYATVYTISSTSTFSSTSYTQSASDSWLVETGAALVVPNLSSFKTGDVFVNSGRFIADCQSGATMQINWFNIKETGNMSVTCVSSLTFNSLYTNNWGTWTMSSVGDLSMNLNSIAYTIANTGTLNWSATGFLVVLINRIFDNRGVAVFLTTSRASFYLYGPIMNTGVLRLKDNSNSDVFNTNKPFSNSGYFVVEYGLNIYYSCQITNSMSNSGFMNIYGSNGFVIDV